MINSKQQMKIEKLIDSIELLMRDFDSESGEKQRVTEHIILQSLIWGSQNGYEGLGILENAKDSWKEILKDIKE